MGSLIQHAGWRGRPAWMGKPYSIDLRERVVAAVVEGGLSRNRAAAQFGVGISTAINWVRRFQETGSVAPGKIGGYRPKAIVGRASRLAFAADEGEGLHPARAGRRAGRARAQGRLPDDVELRPCREAELQKKASPPASGIVLTSRDGGRSGRTIKLGSILPAWSSSTRPGPRPTWRRSGDGRHAA